MADRIKTTIYLDRSLMSQLKRLSEQRDGAPVARLIQRAVAEFLRREFQLTGTAESGGEIEMVVQNSIAPKRRPRK